MAKAPPVTPLAIRDTRSFYLEHEPTRLVAPGLVRFVQERGGSEILDYGCATGGYCVALARLGYRCTGVDVNDAYVRRARELGVDAAVVAPGEALPFADRAFDTVLLFEVLEHVEDHEFVLREARRVARRNVLITVPNNGAAPLLRRATLVFDHMLDLDHVNFFTKASLEEALAVVFDDVEVTEREYWDTALYRVLFPRPLALALVALAAAGVIRKKISYRLFAEARLA